MSFLCLFFFFEHDFGHGKGLCRAQKISQFVNSVTVLPSERMTTETVNVYMSVSLNRLQEFKIRSPFFFKDVFKGNYQIMSDERAVEFRLRGIKLLISRI